MISYIGHATLLIDFGDARVLTDPLLRRRVAHIVRRGPPPALETLDDLDAVLISHAHHDHLDVPSLRRLEPDCPAVVPRGCGGIARRARLREVIEMEAGERVALGGVTIEAVRAVHDGRRYPGGRSRAALGYVLEGEPCVYFAGDTDLFPEMRQLAGRIDVAALPVWGWGPGTGRGHLNPERAAEAVRLIEPRAAIPIHWGTMRVIGSRGASDPFAPPRAFVSAAARMAPGVDVRVLAPGQSTSL